MLHNRTVRVLATIKLGDTQEVGGLATCTGNQAKPFFSEKRRTTLDPWCYLVFAAAAAAAAAYYLLLTRGANTPRSAIRYEQCDCFLGWAPSS
jgi:hypothetical protein